MVENLRCLSLIEVAQVGCILDRTISLCLLECPRIVSTDLDASSCKVIDGPLASADHIGRLEEEGWRDGQAQGLGVDE
jgi:hypothetical protein